MVFYAPYFSQENACCCNTCKSGSKVFAVTRQRTNAIFSALTGSNLVFLLVTKIDFAPFEINMSLLLISLLCFPLQTVSRGLNHVCGLLLLLKMIEFRTAFLRMKKETGQSHRYRAHSHAEL